MIRDRTDDTLGMLDALSAESWKNTLQEQTYARLYCARQVVRLRLDIDGLREVLDILGLS